APGDVHQVLVPAQLLRLDVVTSPEIDRLSRLPLLGQHVFVRFHVHRGCGGPVDVLLKSFQQVLVPREVGGHVHLQVGIVDVNYQASGIWQEHSTDVLGVGGVFGHGLHGGVTDGEASGDGPPEGERRVNPSVHSDKASKALDN